MLTLELSPQTEQAFLEGARQRGIAPETYLETLLEAASTPLPARSLLGKYSHLPVSSGNIERARNEEVERETQRETNKA